MEFKPAIVNIQILEKKFKEGDIINSQTLLKRKLVSKIKGKMPKVKILGRGEITKKLIIEGCQVSKQAKEKIEKLGGKIK